ncbi:MAG: hypothetical protein WBC70_04440 [Candidatus Aminicenantales bacterium]
MKILPEYVDRQDLKNYYLFDLNKDPPQKENLVQRKDHRPTFQS